MKNKALEIVKSKYFLAFVAVLALGIFLRTYHFPDWLHFELDQSRDAKVIDLVLEEGITNLPLLGPKAAGTFLRLGPAFYYFSYLSAKVFGPTPSGMAAIMAVFGVLVIPAFYFLARRYFGQRKSILLTFPLAVSLYLVMYSRFSWNPNPLPLFVILTFYSLLRAVDKDEKNQGWWLVATAVSLAITTQFHFLAFLAIPAIAVLFLAYKRPKIRLKFWGAAILAVFWFYIPMAVNEVRTGGDNAKEFVEAIAGKSSKSPHVLSEKFIKNFYEHSTAYVVISSGYEGTQSWTIRKTGTFDFQFLCTDKCKDKLKWGYLGMLFIFLSLFLAARRFWQEEDQKKKDFLALVLLWFAVPYIMFIPLAYDISPRFFLMTAPLPFIFLGLVTQLGERILPKKIGQAVSFLIIFVLAGLNLNYINQRFSELRRAPDEAVESAPDRVLKERQRVTLEQQYAIIDYVESIYRKNGYPVYLNSEPFYRRSLLYHIDKRSIPRDDLRNTSNAQKVYREGNYFLVYPTLSNYEKDIAGYEKEYEVIDKKPFGTLLLIQLSPRESSITDQRQIFEDKKTKDTSGAAKRYTWEEIFNDSGEDENEADK